MALSRADIEGQQADLERREVDVPEWGGSVFVRTMDGNELVEFAEGQQKQKSSGMFPLLVRCLCDEGGGRLFEDHEAELLGQRSSKVLKRLFDVAAEMNGLDEDTEEAAKN